MGAVGQDNKRCALVTGILRSLQCNLRVGCNRDREQDIALADMAQCVDADQIWRYVALKELQVAYHKATDSVFVTLAGECDWEEEHGLQLVFRDGTTLTRVSAQDGHPVD